MPLAPTRLLAATALAAACLAAVPATAGSIEEGKGIYNTYCLICHGPKMMNTGARAYDLRKFPLDQHQRFVISVREGKKKMPAWGDVLDDQQIEHLWAYVKTRGK